MVDRFEGYSSFSRRLETTQVASPPKLELLGRSPFLPKAALAYDCFLLASDGSLQQ
jgi:hypothetical protein